MTLLRLLVLLVFLALRLASAQISLGFPFDEQLPSVARVNTPYSFTVAYTTYQSTTSSSLSIEYTVSNLPDWLRFDGATRTFLGTPAAKDLGKFSVTLNGKDLLDGSTISNDYTLLVSDNPGILVADGMTGPAQAAQFGNTNGHGALVLRPGQDVYVKFKPSTFVSTNPIAAYYGVSSDRSPLPSWLKFDSNELSFAGLVPAVPSPDAPAISYQIGLVATDFANYAAAETTFSFIVGGHQLSTSQKSTTIVNGTLGSYFSFQVPVTSSVYLDDLPLGTGNISDVLVVDLPQFASWDKSNYTIAGFMPSTNLSSSFNVSIGDKYGDLVILMYTLQSIGSPFTVKNLLPVNATRGEFFQYQLDDSLFTTNSTTVTAKTNNATWLSFDANNRTFTGETPRDFAEAYVSILASSNGESNSMVLPLRGVERQVKVSSSSLSITSSSTHTLSSKATDATTTELLAPLSTPTNPAHAKSLLSNKKKLAIGLGVGIPCFFILLALLFFLLCARRRTNNKKKENKDVEKERKRDLTGFGMAKPQPKTGSPSGGNGGFSFMPGMGVASSAAVAARPLTNPRTPTRDIKAAPLTAVTTAATDKKLSDDDCDEFSTYSSSLTEFGSSSNVAGADGKNVPAMSWRHNTHQNDLRPEGNRFSAATQDTVNTNVLFLVRVVDDDNGGDGGAGGNRDSDPMLQSSTFLSLDSERPYSHDDLDLYPKLEKNLELLLEENLMVSDSSAPPRRNPSRLLHDSSSNMNTFDSDSSSRNLLARMSPSHSPSEEEEEEEEESDTAAAARPFHAESLPTSFTVPARNLDDYVGSSGERIGIEQGDARLVEFTRKGSLRDASRLHPYVDHEHSASISNDVDSV